MPLLLRPPSARAVAARPRTSGRGGGRGSRIAVVVPRAGPESKNDTAHHEEPAPLPGANQLVALRSASRLVIDTADIDAISQWKPEDATTNPSLLLKASASERYRPLAEAALASRAGRTVAPGQSCGRGDMAGAADALAVSVGTEILKLVPGRVSTETDARLAHDTQATVEHALRLVGLYEEAGVSRERVLIKVASTWEGVRAVETLQKEGIACNCTLLFSLAQAVACAEAGATLISPFVGRILDWHVQHEGHHFEPQEDPGVAVVRRIYDYYKSHRIATTVMAASFRNVGEVRELAGVDAITLAPAILQGLAGSTEPLTRKLSPAFAARHVTDARVHAATTLPEFEAQLGHGMARDKLQEGVALFARDAAELENWLAKLKAGEAAAAQ